MEILPDDKYIELSVTNKARALKNIFRAIRIQWSKFKFQNLFSCFMLIISLNHDFAKLLEYSF